MPYFKSKNIHGKLISTLIVTIAGYKSIQISHETFLTHEFTQKIELRRTVFEKKSIH